MKRTSILFLICCMLALTATARERTLLNFGWKFLRMDAVGAESASFDDREWQTVDLPHDASINGPFQKNNGATARNGFRTIGKGWYRRHLAYNTNWEGKRIILTFEGIYRLATIYVNGQACGNAKKNGYMEIELDITDKLHKGDNIIAVHYDNTDTKSSRWYNGEGINRNVWLTIASPLHIDRYGTYITTPEVSKDEALVRVETSVKNDSKDSVLCTLVTDIIDPQGKVVATKKAVASFASGETYTFAQEIVIAKPQLWNVGEGFMYKAISRLENDEYTTPFGIRTLRFTPDNGLFVNGKRVYINGVCLHSDLGPLGTASFDAAWHRRLSAIVDSLGCNAIRLSHNVYPSYVLDWADQHGLLIFDEMLDKWNGSFYGVKADFCSDMLEDMKEWIRRDRNHPSVFIWGVGNEVYEQIQKEKTQKYGIERLKTLVALVKELDPTRKTTVGQYPNRYGSKTRKNAKNFNSLEPHQFEFYTDVVSTNYLESFWDRDHEKYPQLILMESEMAVGDLGYDFFNFDHSYPVGQFYWGGTDYIGESFGWPAKGWVRGLIDFTNRLKPLGQSVKSFYTTKPMTKILTRPRGGAGNRVWNDLKMTWITLEEHWNYKEGDTLTIQVASNCKETELFLNGKSLGRKALPKQATTEGGKGIAPELTWQTPYIPGKLEAVGYDSEGKVIASDRLATAGKPHHIIANVDKKTLKANGVDLAYIDYVVVDKQGNVVPTPVNLTFSVKGAATLQAQASGDMLSHEPWQGSNSRTTYNGHCQLILRAGQAAGKVKVTAKAKDIPTSTLLLQVTDTCQ